MLLDEQNLVGVAGRVERPMGDGEVADKRLMVGLGFRWCVSDPKRSSPGRCDRCR